jgi:uncharacterized protein (TIGR02996 family)
LFLPETFMARLSRKPVHDCRPEEAFLQSIVANPGDEGLWLILADWLEEHDEPRRAELLRLHRQLLATCCKPGSHPKRAEQQARIVGLLTEGVRPSVPRRTLKLARGVEMSFVWVPPGRFIMGSPRREEGRDDDEKRHPVTVARGFWLGVTLVTQAQWGTVVGSRPSHFKGKDRPVENVSWNNCQDFCRQLSAKTETAITLPREVEWEYACRAGTTTAFFFGDTITPEQANYDGNYVYGKGPEGAYHRKTTAVAAYPPNAWGLDDMHGNVWEWCQDRYSEDYVLAVSEEGAADTEGSFPRVLHGGCWDGIPTTCRSAERLETRQSDHDWYLGLRVVIR